MSSDRPVTDGVDSPEVPEKVNPQTEANQEGVTATPPAEAPSEAAATSEPAPPAETPAPVAETPPVENPAETAPTEPVAAEAAESPADAAPPVESASDEQARKPRLNPTVDPEAKAVPHAGSFPGAAPPEPAPTEEAQEKPAAPPQQAVEIPRDSDLDAETEAEIAAALASGELPDAIGNTPASPDVNKTVAAGVSEDELEQGTKLKGKVQSVHGDTVIVDVGYRASAFVPVRQFESKLPEVGSQVTVVVEKYDSSEGMIACSLPKATRQVGNWSEVSVGQIVDCMVVKSNKGGLEVSISNLRGFLPAGQVDFGFISNLDQYVGQKVRVKITEVNPQKRNLVVSRRAFLEIARGEAREELLKTLAVGQTHTGTVKTIKDYGAFIDIGGVDGLLHVAEMSWSRVAHPSDLLKEGQEVQVQVLNIDNEKSKISLGMRQLQQNPWNNIESRFPVSSTQQGKVTKTTEFGAFVALDDGIEGLIHISELDHKRVHRVTDVVHAGQEVEAQVLSIDIPRKRIALSLKALQARPDTPAKKNDVDLAPGGDTPYERKRKGPLKGGTGGGGLLFGGGSSSEEE